jgi:hypothetical protein
LFSFRFCAVHLKDVRDCRLWQFFEVPLSVVWPLSATPISSIRSDDDVPERRICRECALATPEPIKNWSLTSLKEKLIKTGAKVVSHGRYVAFQMAEVAISRNLFADILRLIAELRPPPLTSTA